MPAPDNDILPHTWYYQFNLRLRENLTIVRTTQYSNNYCNAVNTTFMYTQDSQSYAFLV